MASQYPFPLNVIRTAFPLLETIAPGYAAKLAGNLFITPVKFGFTEKEKEFLPKLEQFQIEVNGMKLAAYKMGKGPEVICVHGWAGRGLQFRMFAESLAASGYTFLAFDAPAHGASDGKRSNLFEFKDALEEMLNQAENPKAVIGHSLGAAATSYAISEGVKVPSFVSLAAPVIAQSILDDFCEIINASRKIQSGIRKKAVSEFSVEFDSVAMEETLKRVSVPMYALHGDSDRDVNVNHLDVIKSLRPDAKAEVLPGIHHRSILKDEGVIEKVIEWVGGVTRTGIE